LHGIPSKTTANPNGSRRKQRGILTEGSGLFYRSKLRGIRPDEINAAAQKLSGQIKTVLPGEELTEKGVLIKTLPAYNLTKFRSPGVPYHPKDAGHVGYLITVQGVTIYHPGDTDFIPEMKGLKPDVALLPVSGTYVMTAEEAAEAAASIQPKVAIPMHVGEGIGSLADAERFKEKATVPVVIKPIEK